jgi:hypothetical protein
MLLEHQINLEIYLTFFAYLRGMVDNISGLAILAWIFT